MRAQAGGPSMALLIPFLLSGSFAFSQPICETVKDDVDEFTEKHVLQITASHYSKGPAFDWLSINDEICLRIHWTLDDARPAVVFEGDTLMLKLENDTVIILTSAETTVGKEILMDDGGRVTQGTYCYRVDHEQFAYINHYWVQKLRIYFREGHREFEAANDPGWQMGLWRSSNCMRKGLSLRPEPAIISTFGHTREDQDH
jgi:hypothetical protein